MDKDELDGGDDEEQEPEFCPYCGYHQIDEGDDDIEDEDSPFD